MILAGKILWIVSRHAGRREKNVSRMSFVLRFLVCVCAMLMSGANVRSQGVATDSLSMKYELTDSVKQGSAGKIYASDTVADKRDIDVYKKLGRQASKRKITGQLFSWIVNMPENPPEDVGTKAIHEEYLPYEGRIIRDIKIVVLSPFGSDINYPDSANSSGWIEGSANKLHIATKQYVIRDRLLFHKGESVDPLNIAEAEVFLRNTEFINDARIRIDSVEYTNEADITVIVRDVWSAGFDVTSISTSMVGVNVFDKNFFGAGNHAYVKGIYRSTSDKHFGYGLGYRHHNIRRSFINLGGFYHDEIVNRSFELSMERPLRTNLRIFGQVAYSQNTADPNYSVWDSVTPVSVKNFSASAGYAFEAVDKHTDRRWVLSFRYMDKIADYQGVEFDVDSSMYRYASSKMALAQISLYQQKYHREYLINAFGTTENIAYGYNFSVQVGYNRRPHFDRHGLYASLKISASQHFDFGNLFVQGAAASYFDRKSAYDGVLNFQMKYFSPLINLSRSRLRVLMNFNYSKVLNPVFGIGNYLYFGEMSTMDTEQFNSIARGNERLMFNVENNVFAPWNLGGFRFMLFSFLDIGWISNQNIALVDPTNLYWGTGVGLRIRNDLLVFRTLEIKLGWYPRLNQSGFNNFSNFSSSTPTVSPDFIPKYPEEIPLSY